MCNKDYSFSEMIAIETHTKRENEKKKTHAGFSNLIFDIGLHCECMYVHANKC
jgi:hypothetical protein